MSLAGKGAAFLHPRKTDTLLTAIMREACFFEVSLGCKQVFVIAKNELLKGESL